MIKLPTKHSSGQAAVEFAIALPLLAVVFLGVIEFGFLLYAHVQVANAAREGARAGSLYLGSRFHYTSCRTGQPCRSLAGFGDGGSNPDCWTLQAWVENGLVEHDRDSNGCPLSSFQAVSSFGLLNASQCPSATTGSDCWWVNITPVWDPNVTVPPNPHPLPLAGSQLQVEVIYRYNLVVTSGLLGMLNNPVTIDRTVLMEVQSN